MCRSMRSRGRRDRLRRVRPLRSDERGVDRCTRATLDRTPSVNFETSDEDYLYPADYFVAIDVPADAVKVFSTAT
jgi:hypothetical protein